MDPPKEPTFMTLDDLKVLPQVSFVPKPEKMDYPIKPTK